MADETFQGWKNMETWDIGAVADNHRPLTEAVGRVVRASAGRPLIELADALKDFFARVCEGDDESARLLRSQLVSTALSRVDWRAVAQSYRDETEVDPAD